MSELAPAEELAMRMLNDRTAVRTLAYEATKAIATRDVAQLAATLVQFCELTRVRLIVRR
jgi:hypothetical protein